MECIRCGCKLGLGDNQERCLCHTCELVEMVNDKDHRIAVLERALKNMQDVIMNSSDGCESCDYYEICDKAPLRDCFEVFIDEAEKELKGENK